MTCSLISEVVDPADPNWQKQLGHTEFELKRAVAEVGSAADAVKRRLSSRIGTTTAEIGFWSRELGCGEQRLHNELKRLGCSADAADVPAVKYGRRCLRSTT